MSANHRRGEIEVELDGSRHRMCLTLGALAELEDVFEVPDLGALVERFSQGKLSATDMMRVVGAGLRGAGCKVADEDVGQMTCQDGATGFARIVSELLQATFGVVEASKPNP